MVSFVESIVDRARRIGRNPPFNRAIISYTINLTSQMANTLSEYKSTDFSHRGGKNCGTVIGTNSKNIVIYH